MWKKFPWLSTILVILTYGVFGYKVSDNIERWSSFWSKQGQLFGLSLSSHQITAVIVAITIMGILIVIALENNPSKTFEWLFGKWLRSSQASFISILAWSFIFVFFLRWINYSAGLLVLLSASFLNRYELRKAGYNKWVVFVLLSIVCVLGFMGGVSLEHNWYHLKTTKEQVLRLLFMV